MVTDERNNNKNIEKKKKSFEVLGVCPHVFAWKKHSYFCGTLRRYCMFGILIFWRVTYDERFVGASSRRPSG